MAGIDYKAVIDGMKWEPTPLEIELKMARDRNDTDAMLKAIEQLSDSPPPKAPLMRFGLREPVFNAFVARAEWELLELEKSCGEGLVQEYSLQPAGQNGIGVDWKKLGSERIWVPADYLHSTLIHEKGRALFSNDDSSTIRASKNAGDYALYDSVIRGSSSKTGAEKIKALLSDPEWRMKAREYSLKLLDNAGCVYTESIAPEYRPLVDAMVAAYRSEMRLK